MAVLIPIAISTAISLGASLLISALQPKPPGIERNKQDTRIQSSEYGTPITRGYGTFRTAGTLIWEAGTGLVDHVTTQHTGGGKRRGPDVTTHSYTVSCALLVCAGPVQGITRIWADTDLIYNSATLGAVTTTLTNNGNPGLSIYIGDELQMPNSWIVADKGVGNVSAHRGYCYVVFKDLNLDRFGDRIPTFTFEVVQGTVAVADVVTAECALVGLTSASLNLTQCTDPVRGMVINKQQAPRVALEELARDFWCDFVDVDGQIKGVKRPQTTYGLINALDLAAYEEGGEAPEQLDATRGLALDIPRTVEVTYFDYNRLYENGKQTFSRQVPGSQQVLAVDTPLVMTAPEADKLAKI
ncbi:MAG: phage tail protein, partial [Acetobacteraceae bacterium]|nr:phage tail protein [Acetobacteraceae bacterium]